MVRKRVGPDSSRLRLLAYSLALFAIAWLVFRPIITYALLLDGSDDIFLASLVVNTVSQSLPWVVVAATVLFVSRPGALVWSMAAVALLMRLPSLRGGVLVAFGAPDWLILLDILFGPVLAVLALVVGILFARGEASLGRILGDGGRTGGEAPEFVPPRHCFDMVLGPARALIAWQVVAALVFGGVAAHIWWEGGPDGFGDDFFAVLVLALALGGLALTVVWLPICIAVAVLAKRGRLATIPVAQGAAYIGYLITAACLPSPAMVVAWIWGLMIFRLHRGVYLVEADIRDAERRHAMKADRWLASA